jgi:hypothetical protein
VLHHGGRETVEEVGFVDALGHPELRDLVFDLEARGDGGEGFASDDAGYDARLSMAAVPVERLFGPREDVSFERLSRRIAQQASVFVEVNQ